MKTVYIDVYFLINFSVNLLSLALSVSYMKISCSIRRLVLSGAVGALYAVFAVLFSKIKYIMLPLGFLIFLLMVIIVTKNTGHARKLKFALAFFAMQLLIAGIVYFSYGVLDRILNEEFFEEEFAATNQKFLIWALIILLSYGVVKVLLYTFMVTESERVIKLCVGYREKEVSFDSLVDTGNLATDPTDNSPVVFINRELAERITGEKFGSEFSLDTISDDFKKRIRIIPVSGEEKKILYGFVSEYVTAVKGKKFENIKVTFAIDMKGETYGGYQALLPAVALDNVF